MIFMVPSNLNHVIHSNLARTCPCTPLIWSLTHQTDFSERPQTCHLTRNFPAIWVLCLSLASLQLPGGDQESTQQAARYLIIDPWLRGAAALTRLFSPSIPFQAVCILPSRIPTNYIYKYLRCCLGASIKLLPKILKESDTIQIFGVISEQAPQTRKTKRTIKNSTNPSS